MRKRLGPFSLLNQKSTKKAKRLTPVRNFTAASAVHLAQRLGSHRDEHHDGLADPINISQDKTCGAAQTLGIQRDETLILYSGITKANSPTNTGPRILPTFAK